MSMEKSQQDFKFKSTLGGKILLWLCGIAPLLFSVVYFLAFLEPPRVTGEAFRAACAFEAILWIFGCLILLTACEIQILDGQFRFRRVFFWRSVPLEAISRVWALRPAGVYVRVDHGGKRYRLIFYPGDYEESSPPSVINFLERVCTRNLEKSESRPRGVAAERGPRGFTYQSTLGGIFYLWCCAMLLLWLADKDLWALDISGHLGSSLVFGLFYLLLSVLGGAMLFGSSDVQILDGEVRFRRLLLGSKSVPLNSITRARRVWLPPCVYVRADYAGNRYRFIFAPVERLGRIPLVLYFLQEVCKANAEKSEPNT